LPEFDEERGFRGQLAENAPCRRSRGIARQRRQLQASPVWNFHLNCDEKKLRTS